MSHLDILDIVEIGSFLHIFLQLLSVLKVCHSPPVVQNNSDDNAHTLWHDFGNGILICKAQDHLSEPNHNGSDDANLNGDDNSLSGDVIVFSTTNIFGKIVKLRE